MAFGHFKLFILPPPVSTLILTSSQFCVFSIPLQAHHQQPKRKTASLNCGSYMYTHTDSLGPTVADWGLLSTQERLSIPQETEIKAAWHQMMSAVTLTTAVWRSSVH